MINVQGLQLCDQCAGIIIDNKFMGRYSIYREGRTLTDC